MQRIAALTAPATGIRVKSLSDPVGQAVATACAARSSNTLDKIDFAQNATFGIGNITVNANSVTGPHVLAGGNVTFNLYCSPTPDSTTSQTQV